MEEILRIFPNHVSSVLLKVINQRQKELQEIRIRQNQPIEVIFNHDFKRVRNIVTKEDITFILNQLSEYSLYRLTDELREGYITIQGGHRIGLAGQVVSEKGSVKTIKHISFLNIRIAKEQINVATPIIKYLYKDNYLNTLIVGPPQAGKTTYLRDISRLIGLGWGSVEPKKVAIIDERSEIAACKDGVPQHQIGMRTDVMDACPKAEGMMMVIRSMSPDLLIVDEIGSKEDVHALLEAMNAGVKIICTIHGSSLSELQHRPSLRPLFKQKIFKRFLIMNKQPTPGVVTAIYDQSGSDVLKKSRCLQNEVDWSTPFHRDDNMARI